MGLINRMRIMEIQKEKILEVLRSIRHPETKEDIVSMGMVERGDLQGRRTVDQPAVSARPMIPYPVHQEGSCMRAMNNAFGEETLKPGHIQVLVPEAPPPERSCPE